MTRFLVRSLLLALSLATPAFAADKPARPLHLLLITADDLNADSSGFMGNKLETTPHLDAFVRKEVAQYYTGVRRFDQSFGAAMQALKDSGQEKDTLVVFLSDHGMSFPFSKATVYRNGTWSPVLFHWPGMPRTGADRDVVITHVNTVSSGRAFPGRCARTKTRSYIWYVWPDGGKTQLKVEAMADLTFKALAAEGAGNPRIKARVDQYLLGVTEGLYDLEKDPDERVNLMNDPKYKADRDRLRQRLLAHMEKTRDPQLDAFHKLLP